MTKDRASRYLKNIMSFKEAVLLNKKEIIKVNAELKTFIDVIDKLKSEIKDKETLNFVHMSASTFYRIKNYICEKVILLCAARGLVRLAYIMDKNIRIKAVQGGCLFDCVFGIE